MESLADKYKLDEITDCWNWLGSIVWSGYGQIRFDGRKWLAHRLFYTMYKGEIPSGLTLDHLCRNRRCVNPAHLEAVTYKVNHNRGTQTKLTADHVVEVRLRAHCGEPTVEIARLFNMSYSYIWAVVNNKARV